MAKRTLNWPINVNNQSKRFSLTTFMPKVYRTGSDAFVEKIQLFVSFFQKKFHIATKYTIITTLLLTKSGWQKGVGEYLDNLTIL